MSKTYPHLIPAALTALLLVVGGAALAQSSTKQSAPAQPQAHVEQCEHDIEQAKCPFCNPDRIDQLGMCREHGVAEALCVKCRPFLKAAFVATGDWCGEHGTPESQCLLCNPSLGTTDTQGPSVGAQLQYQREPSVTCSTSSTTVRLSSPSVAQTAGLEYQAVRAGPLTRDVTRNAEVIYNANRYARLSSRASGVVVEMIKDLGETVAEGEAIAVIDSTELGSAKADLLQAREMLSLWEANAEREQALATRGAGTQRDALEAQTRWAEARIAVSRAEQRLRNLGLRSEQIEQVVKDADTSSLLEVAAPFGGIVVERSAVMGEVVDSSTLLFSVADTSRMWAMIDLTEADLAVIRPGQKVTLAVDGMRGRPIPGELTWISSEVDHETRTIKARAEFDNTQGLLRANMFGQVAIQAGANRDAVSIPKEAVQWEGCCNVAFVKADAAGTTFQPRRLTLGFDAGDRYEVLEGLAAGDTIVTRGSFILKNEIRKDAVGAGCCEVDHLAK